MVNAPFARQGGKQLLKKVIIPLLPSKDEIDIYVEPFVGGGVIFYNTPDYKKKVINDLDKNVYTIHKALKNDAENINKNIERRFTRSNFEKVRNKNDATSILQRCKMSFFANCSTYRPIDTGKTIKTDFTKYTPLLKNTTILNKNFKTVIEKYDSPKTFFYLDPPYEKSEEQDLYKNIKEFVSPEDVYNSLKNIKGKFLLSYNDSANIRNLFADYKIKKIKTRYSSKIKGGTPKDINELLISNF